MWPALHDLLLPVGHAEMIYNDLLCAALICFCLLHALFANRRVFPHMVHSWNIWSGLSSDKAAVWDA